MPSSKGLSPFAAVMLAACLAACGGEEAEPAQQADEAHPVVFEPAAEVVLPRVGSAPAEVLSSNESELSADISARVEAVVEDVGSTVEEGELLLRLDDRDYRLALEQAGARAAAAQARLDLANSRLSRARELLAERFVSEDEVQALQAERDSAAAELRGARADRAVAERNVAKTRITAPFDGAVVERFAQVGTLAAAGTPLLRMVASEGLEVEASVQAADAAGFAAASGHVFEHAGEEYPVTLLRMVGVVDRTARTQVARLGFDGLAAPVGSAGTLRWEAPGQRLPPDLLVLREGTHGFFVVDADVARFVPVPEAQPGRAFQVELAPDTRVIVRGQQALEDGDPVREAARDEEPGVGSGDAPAADAGETRPADATGGGAGD